MECKIPESVLGKKCEKNVCTSDDNVNKKCVSRVHEDYSIADLIKCISIISFNRDVILPFTHAALKKRKREKT